MIDDRIGRRQALREMTVMGTGAAMAAGLPFAAAVRAHNSRTSLAEHTVTIVLDEPIATIRPELYSQFTEHIGGVIYDGIWVGPESKVPNHDGIRSGLVEAVRELGPVAIRWSGGCF